MSSRPTGISLGRHTTHGILNKQAPDPRELRAFRQFKAHLKGLAEFYHGTLRLVFITARGSAKNSLFTYEGCKAFSLVLRAIMIAAKPSTSWADTPITSSGFQPHNYNQENNNTQT